MVSGTVTRRGYVAHILREYEGAKPRRMLIHRMVALAFLPNPNKLPVVSHIDGNPSNNDVSNLRWSTHRENTMDMRRHGTMQDGEKCITAKITEEIALEIRRRHKEEGRGSGIRMAEEYGLSPAQISRIANGFRWQYL